MNEEVQLSKEKVLFYGRVLISHTTANNVLRDSNILDPAQRNAFLPL
jgi:hypothetical protein